MVNIITLNELHKYNYSINVINGLKQYWIDNNKFSCITRPKKVNMLMYTDGLDALYRLPNGKTMIAHSGNVVYIPIGAEYEVEFINSQGKGSNTIGVNFYTYDPDGHPFAFSEDITIFNTQDKSYFVLFNKIDKYSEQLIPNYARMKSGFYDILANLYDTADLIDYDKFSMISNGILHLDSQSDDNLSIPEIAKLCNISEAYFRRLFKEYSGMSPNQYRLYHKIERAKTLLKYDYLTVSETADKLSFTSVAYFIKVFKEHTGNTPLEYAKKWKYTVKP